MTTYLNDPNFTMQTAFNDVWEHLHRQGKAAVSAGYCCYRGPDGGKCALGCLIPDGLYRPAIEGKGAFTVLEKYMRLSLRSDLAFLLREMQDAHDNTLRHDGIAFWRARMGKIADQYNLTVPPVPA